MEKIVFVGERGGEAGLAQSSLMVLKAWVDSAWNVHDYTSADSESSPAWQGNGMLKL